MFDASGVGLEIGGSMSPLLRKRDGYRIETLDHASAQDLRNKYKDDPRVDVARIEDVDFVTDGRSIADTVPRRRFYDYILASHVVEHMPDLLGFLKDCALLLKDTGVLVLAVPDKRRCFDVFQSTTSTGQILQAHLEKRTRHTAGAMFDHCANHAMRNDEIVWVAGSDAPLRLVYDLDFAFWRYRTARDSSDYHDVHAWHFTPSSWRLIVSDLAWSGDSPLKEKAFAESEGCEFYSSLSLTGDGCPLDRLTLVTRAIAEQREVQAGPAADAEAPASALEQLERRVRRLEAASSPLSAGK
jgi:predicted SAM-dependent methyltransferase